MQKPDSSDRGFTLIELLVVIAIIGILSSVVLASLNTARQKGQTAAVEADLQSIRNAIYLLDLDTGRKPGGYDSSLCFSGNNPSDGNGLAVSHADAGLVAYNSSKFPGWKGPYLPTGLKDPWGHEYYYDSLYSCSGGANDCTSGTASVIHSGGPNGSAANVYDTDNISLVICPS
ncbi:prepilin-type N-terminal cleavage/methylation domain-containing protein [Patescibacteria group bacterium]|nr:prepilin-type N-terminal cleavage/methylation domain-containing protein [Patescibacteria group bacterium]MBU1755274.1 prepilin-type N-terminal cleavage/methylation domain-containing protein [Patescibacteria group bacterium]